MKSLPRPLRVTPATIVSFIALFVALGGTGYAATTIASPKAFAARVVFNSRQTEKIKSIILGLAPNLAVKSAKKATTATFANTAGTASNATTAGSATTATFATNATNATNATSAGFATAAGAATTAGTAGELNGQPQSFYAHEISTGGLKAIAYSPTTALAATLAPAVGVFTLTEVCTQSTATPPVDTATLAVTGTTGSVIGGVAQTAATPTPVTLGTATSTGTTFKFDNSGSGVELVSPTGAVYVLDSAIEETNPPSASNTGCGFSVVAIQG